MFYKMSVGRYLLYYFICSNSFFFLFPLPIYYENVPEFLFTVEVHRTLKKPPTTSINVTSFVTNLVHIVLKTRNSIKYVFWFRQTLSKSIYLRQHTNSQFKHFFSGSLIPIFFFCFNYFLFLFQQ